MSLLRINLDQYGKPLTRLAIVIDIDQTCTHSHEEVQSYKELKIFEDPTHMKLRKFVHAFTIKSEDGKYDLPIWTVFRPGSDEWAKFVFSYFSVVIVWTAGTESYAHRFCERYFGRYGKPHVILSKYDCKESEGPGSRRVLKPISELFNHPQLKGLVTAKNTFVLDDNEATFQMNPDNAIHIPPYNVMINHHDILGGDDCLDNLREWLMRPETISCRDVRQLDKSQIFRPLREVAQL